MEAFIVLSWFLLMLGFPLAFVVAAYNAYIWGMKVSELLARVMLAMIVYGLLTALLFYPVLLVIFAGAHTEPVGNALAPKEEAILFLIVVMYGGVGWLCASLVNGGLIRPNSPSLRSSKPPSILPE